MCYGYGCPYEDFYGECRKPKGEICTMREDEEREKERRASRLDNEMSEAEIEDMEEELFGGEGGEEC